LFDLNAYNYMNVDDYEMGPIYYYYLVRVINSKRANTMKKL